MQIAIVGNSGSGKSTLARQLSGGRVDVLDLDTIAWEPGQTAVSRDASLAVADVHEFCRCREEWIVEGCYGNLIAATLVCGPELILLNPGREQCEANCRARPWEAHKYASREEQDAKLGFLLEWVADYYVRDGDMSLAAHESLFEQYAGPRRLLTSLPPLESFNKT